MRLVRKILARVFLRKDRTDLSDLIEPYFIPRNEKMGYLSSEYPLLKYTHGFSGAYRCKVSVEKKEKPHVIFVFLESFRSKDIGVLGGKHGITPHFDRLAKEGILFSNFYSNSVRTSRAVISSLFGIPSDVDASEVAKRISTPFIGLPQILQNEGYHLSYLHNGPLAFENQEIFFRSQGYQTIVGQRKLLEMFPNAAKSSWGLLDEHLFDYAIQFLEENDTSPQFLTLFTISNHHPWNMDVGLEPPSLPPSLGKEYKKYLTAFHYTDACLGLFLKRLQEKKMDQKAIFFIMGDHGYPMGEHENHLEQRYLYEENIRVPLLIYAPGRIDRYQKVHCPASQLDLTPTVMDILHKHGLNLSIGSSLIREMPPRFTFFHNPYVFQNFGCRDDRYKFIYTKLSREMELYDLIQDPEETCNLIRIEPSRAKNYLAAVQQYYRIFLRLYSEKQLAPTVFSRDYTR